MLEMTEVYIKCNVKRGVVDDETSDLACARW